MKRVLLDQGLPLQAVSILVANDWDAIHVSQVGMSDAEDRAILEYAARELRIAVTLDRDFPQIVALTAATFPSVILIRQQGLRAAGVAALLERIWAEYEGPLRAGCVLTAGPNGVRAHNLPLR